jgi:hypothetical protein
VALILAAEPEMDLVIFNADEPSSVPHEIEVSDCFCQVMKAPQHPMLDDKLVYPLIFGTGTVSVCGSAQWGDWTRTTLLIRATAVSLIFQYRGISFIK